VSQRLGVAVTVALLALCSPTVARAVVIDIGVIGGVDYFYDETNDRTWVDHTFAVNLTSEEAEAAVNGLGLSFATVAEMTSLLASIGGSGTTLFDNVRAITNTLSPSTVLGWMGPNFSQPYGTYEVYSNGLHQPVGRSSNAPLTSFNHSVWASVAGDLRNSVPEPTTLLLLSSGLALAALGRRHRQRSG
jgi:PEP-CTERM motif